MFTLKSERSVTGRRLYHGYRYYIIRIIILNSGCLLRNIILSRHILLSLRIVDLSDSPVDDCYSVQEFHIVCITEVVIFCAEVGIMFYLILIYLAMISETSSKMWVVPSYYCSVAANHYPVYCNIL